MNFGLMDEPNSKILSNIKKKEIIDVICLTEIYIY